MHVAGQRSDYRQNYKEVKESQEKKRQLPPPLPVEPIPFDIIKHGARYRRQNSESNVNCYPNGTRHVLFLLDTSGSIGEYDFDIMTSALSTLVHYFCRRIKVAAMTFSDKHYIEFCFNCFDNDCSGRDNARDAMKDIPYRGGWTHTGQATQCACDVMLSNQCGFPTIIELNEPDAICLDVIYVTDGLSNGPKNVCNAVECLYDLEDRGVELTVYAFGVDEFSEEELRCITRLQNAVDHPHNIIFKVQSFYAFANAINKIAQVFGSLTESSDSTPPPTAHTCFTSHHLNEYGIGTDECIRDDIVPQ